jgi:hypothetical protein
MLLVTRTLLGTRVPTVLLRAEADSPKSPKMSLRVAKHALRVPMVALKGHSLARWVRMLRFSESILTPRVPILAHTEGRFAPEVPMLALSVSRLRLLGRRVAFRVRALLLRRVVRAAVTVCRPGRDSFARWPRAASPSRYSSSRRSKRSPEPERRWAPSWVACRARPSPSTKTATAGLTQLCSIRSCAASFLSIRPLPRSSPRSLERLWGAWASLRRCLLRPKLRLPRLRRRSLRSGRQTSDTRASS